MIVVEQVTDKLRKLPLSFQEEVLHFVEFLSQKAQEREAVSEEEQWSEFSLSEAMRGLEDEDLPEYTEADLKEKWR
jgi:hypothetical protein